MKAKQIALQFRYRGTEPRRRWCWHRRSTLEYVGNVNNYQYLAFCLTCGKFRVVTY